MKKQNTIKRIFRPFITFAHYESFSGILLIILTILALAWANSGFAESYFGIWYTDISIGVKDSLFVRSLHFWINDGLMAIFFLVVGLEIKRELINGELKNFRLAAFPIVAAVGGMLFPALIFTSFNFNTEWINGWAIPTATDIAFSIGILSLLGNRVNVKLKVFLVALAIVDDMGAVIIIAIFYSSNISILWLSIGAAIFILQLLMNWKKVTNIFAYLFTGFVLWIALYNTGIHPTIAGVLTAAVIPASDENPKDKRDDSPLLNLERTLHPWVTYMIIPVFAFSNAGVTISGDFLNSLSSQLVLGIILGLVIGKPLGITLLSYFTTKMGWTSLPSGTSFAQIFGVGLVAGIGFTMSLFISNLAFSSGADIDLAKIGILTGSLISGIAGYIFLRIKR